MSKAFNCGSKNQFKAVYFNPEVNLGWNVFTSDFDYNDNGNMSSQTGKFSNIVGACPERSRRDHRNLPVHFYLEGDDELIANYNAEGQRILKESSGGAWSFYITDGMQTLAVIEDDTLRYMNLVVGGTFGRIMVDGSGAITTSNTRYYHITDHLGSTRAVVNNSGSLIETFDYYPFGLLMPKRNTASAETREKFTGHELDDETDHYYMIARRYDPALGRFLGVDPMADEFAGWSPYSYVFNNPLIYSDPTGMAPVCEQEEDCDDTYEVGAIVENRLGSWQYLGDNQWETLSLAEGVDQIQSGLGYALHRLGSTFSTDYHDFGSRTLAEETMINVSNRAPSLEILGGMRALAVRGAGSLASLFRTRSAANTGGSLSTSGVNLGKKLASEAQIAERGRTIISSGNLREAGAWLNNMAEKLPIGLKSQAPPIKLRTEEFSKHIGTRIFVQDNGLNLKQNFLDV